jgi:hypothetical protein
VSLTLFLYPCSPANTSSTNSDRNVLPGPGLSVICGLPGAGKSSVAVPLAREMSAAYLRIDTIEQASLAPLRPGLSRLLNLNGCGLLGWGLSYIDACYEQCMWGVG